MTADTEAKQTQSASKPPREPSPYTERFSTWLPPDIGQRLRHLAVLRHKKVNHVLAEVLDRALPTDAELADQVRGGDSNDQH